MRLTTLIVVDMPTGLIETESTSDKVDRMRSGLDQGGWQYLSGWAKRRFDWERERTYEMGAHLRTRIESTDSYRVARPIHERSLEPRPSTL
ncbi:MAG: hypothetical protein R3A47_01675 [Polyangiales bacterium]